MASGLVGGGIGSVGCSVASGLVWSREIGDSSTDSFVLVFEFPPDFAGPMGLAGSVSCPGGCEVEAEVEDFFLLPYKLKL